MAMVNENVSQLNETVTQDRWKNLYKVAGVAALIAALVFRRWLGAEFSLFHIMGILNVGPASPPVTALDWFAVLQSNAFVGLILLNAFDLVNYALVGLIFLGLYAALRKAARGSMTLAIALALAGIAIYFSSNQAFSLLSLSRQYYASTTDAQKSILLAAGQALLTMSDTNTFGTGVFWAFNFVTVSGLIISTAMLRSSIFPKITAYVGILANVLGLGYFFTLAFNPPLTAIPVSASAPFLLIWYILVGVKLLQLSGKPS